MDVFTEILKYGWGAIPLAIVIRILIEPEWANKFVSNIIRPVFGWFRFGARRFIASEVAFQTTHFYQRYLRHAAPLLPDLSVRIKWVDTAADPVFARDGSLLLYMRESVDQTQNVLAATKMMVSTAMCPLVRTRISSTANNALDLTILRRLSLNLGPTAVPVYERLFLSPAIENDANLRQLYAELIDVDRAGTFTAILVEELTNANAAFHTDATLTDITSELQDFIGFLVREARRDRSEEIPLSFIGDVFRVGIILLAIGPRATLEGVDPYTRRAAKDLAEGCESIYVVAFSPAFKFFDRVVAAFKADHRLKLVKEVRTKISRYDDDQQPRRIAQFRTMFLFDTEGYADLVKRNGIAIGDRVDATVADTAVTHVLFDVGGLSGSLVRGESAWNPPADCRDLFASGSVHHMIVKELDERHGKLILSGRLPELDPWRQPDAPREGDRVRVGIETVNKAGAEGTTLGGICTYIPDPELAWHTLTPKERQELEGRTVEATVIERRDSDRALICSIRRLTENPWTRLPETVIEGKAQQCSVVEIMPTAVRVDLGHGFTGILRGKSLERAGFELADYHRTVQIGQVLEVTITHIHTDKRKIIVDLSRNLAQNDPSPDEANSSAS